MVLRSDDLPGGSAEQASSAQHQVTPDHQQYARPPFLGASCFTSLLLEDDSELWEIYNKTNQFIRSIETASSLTEIETKQLGDLKKFAASFEEKLHRLTQLRFDLNDIEDEKASLMTQSQHSSISSQDLHNLKSERDRLKQRIQRDCLPPPQPSPFVVNNNDSHRQSVSNGPRQPPPPGFLSLDQLLAGSSRAPNGVVPRSFDNWACSSCTYLNPVNQSQCLQCGFPHGATPATEPFTVLTIENDYEVI